jgi:hypothetical protein
MAQVIIELTEYKQLLDKAEQFKALTEGKDDVQVRYTSTVLSPNVLELFIHAKSGKTMKVGDLKLEQAAKDFTRMFDLFILRRNDKL